MTDITALESVARAALGRADKATPFQDFWTESSGIRCRFTKESDGFYAVTIYEATPDVPPLANVRIANYRAKNLAEVFPTDVPVLANAVLELCERLLITEAVADKNAAERDMWKDRAVGAEDVLHYADPEFMTLTGQARYEAWRERLYKG